MTLASVDRVLEAGGEMGALMRTIDWSATALGPVEGWPQSLRTALSIILRSRFPMFVFWGKDLVQLYNDAYVPITGGKHPASQGCPARETWAEIWDVLEPLVDAVMDRGEATWSEDQLLMMERHGFTEETYFTFSYSPVQDESGGVGGVFCACTETTGRVLADRRVRTVRELAERTRGASNPAEVMRLAADVLVHDNRDIVAAAFYLPDGEGATTATLAATAHLDAGSSTAPWSIDLGDGASDRWGLTAVIEGREPVHIAAVTSEVDALPTAPWGLAPRDAVLLPVIDPASERAVAVAVLCLSPVRQLDDELRSFVALAADTLTKAVAGASAREQERERLEALAELNRAKTEFFGNVSHEFRTPLTLILGPVEQALAAGESLGGAELQKVERNANRLLKLVNTLLDFSRIEAGRLEPEFRPTRLGAYTTELADVFRSAIESVGLHYEVDCVEVDQPVYVDRDLWERIVLNLLSNALKFTQEGTIAVRLRERGNEVELEVHDTGVGISDGDLEHLFERFYRAEALTSRSHEGSGIGLALVASLVELHGGSITVDSEVGTGSTFRVTIPAGQAHLPADRLREDDAWRGSDVARSTYVAEATGWADQADLRDGLAARSEVGGKRAGTVLVVDDNVDMRGHLRSLLSPHYEIITATDGEDALRVLRRTIPDVIVTDVMMPRLDGVGLLRAIRKVPATRAIPVVVLSARAGVEATGETLAAGADDYVVKPFTADQLLARVRANLEMARMRSRLAWESSRADLLAGVSHDMQTPIAVILATLNELTTDDLEDAERAELIENAITRARHLRLLIQQFLDDARLDSGEALDLQLRAVDIAAIVAGTLEELGHDDRVTMHASTAPPASADAERVRNIITNLVENAVRYTSGPVDVTIGASDGGITVAVADTGEPLPEEELSRVFERFYRGSSAEGTTGTGLGLYISRTLAEMQNGYLEAEATPAGNRFLLWLPAATTRPEEPG